MKETAWVELMQEIKNGNVDALSKLYDEASGLVFSVAFRILENRADAEEVTLDVFTQAWKTASTWDTARGSVTAWLVLLARSRSLDRVRWRKSRSGAEVADTALNTFAASGRSAEELIEVRQQQERVQTALGQLNAAQRKSLDLAFFGGLTHQEIAEKLGEPLGTVKSRIRSAMIKMKDVLEGLSISRQAEGMLQ